MTRRTLPTVVAITVILAALALLAGCSSLGGGNRPMGESLWLGVQETEAGR